MAVAMVVYPSSHELWSGSRESLEQRLEYFVGNDFLADMTFIVGEEKRRIPGHKFILSSCSWEFYNALHLLQIDGDELPIQDVPPEIFLTFLRYCYTGQVDLKPENSVTILKLAYRFNMKPLIKICEQKIIEMIKKETCLQLFSQCDFLCSDSTLKIRILNEIERYFHYIIENDRSMQIFNELSLQAIGDLVQLKELFCGEMDRFMALMKWASKTCEKSGIEPNPRNLRQSLGHVFSKIQFLDMPLEDFM